MKKLLVVAVLVTLTGSAGWSQSIIGTGQELHDQWLAEQKVRAGGGSSNDWYMAGQYEGFVRGVMKMVVAMAPSPDPLFSSITFGQVNAVVGKYLDNHPAEWNYKAEAIVLLALVDAWPPLKPTAGAK